MGPTNANACPNARRLKPKPKRAKGKARARSKRSHPRPKCDAKLIHSLFTTIETLVRKVPQNTHTVYDILRCPGYKTWAQQARNIDDLRQVLDDPSCTCQGRKVRVRRLIEQAWNQIQDPATKEMYDKFRGKNGYASLFPCKGVPSHSYPPSAPSKEMPEVYPYHTLDFILSNVAGTNISWAIDRAADSVFCRKRPNTFWTSLSQGLLGDSKFWAELKASTNNYYQDATLPSNCHPREDLYHDLQTATIHRRGALNPPPRIPIASLQQQLLPDGPYLELCDVTPELWQVVADCFRVELIVIHHNDSSSANNARKRVLTRGGHNSHQIFMLLELDGEYVPLRPMVPDPASWRYTAHMPKPGKMFEDSMRKSGTIRSPCVKLDGRGLPIEPYEGIQKRETSRKKGERERGKRYQEPWWVPEMLVAGCWAARAGEERVRDYLDTDAWC